MNVTMPLLEYLISQVRPHMLSDLHMLDGMERERLIRVLEQLEEGAGTLDEWNDALAYLVQAPPEQSVFQARQRLLALLAGR